MGICFDLSSKGAPKQRRLSGCTKARSLSVNGKTGVEIVKTLKNENLKNGVNIIENCKLLDLIVENNQARGGVFIFNGKPLLITSKAVILATGGAGGLFSFNVNPPDISGTGYAVALKAGAELTNIEFIQIGPGVVYPNKKFIIHSYMWSFLPGLRNIKNEDFLLQSLPPGLDYKDILNEKRFSFPFSCRTDAKYLDIALFKEIEKGNASANRGIFLDISHVPFNEIKEKAHIVYDFFKKSGFDIYREKLEIAPMVQSFNGGVIINETGETKVNGLFAAGEASGGIHGADRPGGNNLIDCQVFGHRAGCSAAAWAGLVKITESAERFTSLKAAEVEKQIAIENGADKQLIDSPDRSLKDLFSENLSIVRNREGLNKVIETTERIFSEVEKGAISAISGVYHTAIIGNAIAMAASAREESRGTHYREDFPSLSPSFGKRINIIFKNNRNTIEFEKTTENTGGLL